MGLAVWAVISVLDGPGGVGPVTRTLLGVVTGSVVYIGGMLALRVPEVTDLTNRLRPRPRPAG